MPKSSDSSEYSAIFYNRPVNKLNKSSIGIIAGKHVQLNSISAIYSIVMAMGHSPVLMVDSHHQPSAVPAELFLKSSNKLSYQNTDEAIELLGNCEIVFLIVGSELSSAMEIFVGRLLESYQGLIVTDYPKLLLGDDIDTPLRLCFANTKSLLAVSKQSYPKALSGLNLKTQLLTNSSQLLGSGVVCVEDNQAIVIDSRGSHRACVINSSRHINRFELVAIIVGLMADKKPIMASNWLEYAQAGGFLYREVYSSDGGGPEALKKYLDSKF